MKSDPTYSLVHINCHLTVRQKVYLEEISKITKRPQTDIVREAVHYWLKGQGVDDGQIYDREELLKEYLKHRGEFRDGVKDDEAKG